MPVGWCRTNAMMFDGCMTMACGETPCGAISRAVLQLLPPSRENARNSGPPDRIMATTVSPGAPNPTRTGFGTTTSEASSKPLQTPFTSQSLLWSSYFVALTGSHATVLKYLPIGVRGGAVVEQTKWKREQEPATAGHTHTLTCTVPCSSTFIHTQEGGG